MAYPTWKDLTRREKIHVIVWWVLFSLILRPAWVMDEIRRNSQAAKMQNRRRCQARIRSWRQARARRVTGE